MKSRTICLRLCALIVLAMSVVLGACASLDVPLAKAPPLYSQEKIQAADHWDNIADAVARRVQKTLEDRPDLVNRPIYVRPPVNDRQFSRAFHRLLSSRLVSKGMQVSGQYEPDAMQLEYEVQIIQFAGGRRQWLPGFASLGLGLLNAFGAGYSLAPCQEIIINTRILHNNRYAMHLSHVAYINEDDQSLYGNSLSQDSLAGVTRRVPLVAR
ncbi:MAG: hypothetical protein LBO77_01980 [Desulfovibrio sp.]|jgi:hypothetical protein|nr:hypothetical protein [Desulfovibrio sp.]